MNRGYKKKESAYKMTFWSMIGLLISILIIIIAELLK